jgi:ribosomal protein S18 acetylase RimI-like enzyme
MVTWREADAAAPDARELLTEYFTSRELGFVGGGYRTVFPDPSQFVPPDGVFLIAEDGGSDVGCGAIRRLGAERFEVKHLWMDPSTRGKGYGRSLLRELERRAVAFGARDVVLDTNDSLLAAAGLYTSSGYERIEPYNDNPNANVWLRKAL